MATGPASRPSGPTARDVGAQRFSAGFGVAGLVRICVHHLRSDPEDGKAIDTCVAQVARVPSVVSVLYHL